MQHSPMAGVDRCVVNVLSFVKEDQVATAGLTACYWGALAVFRGGQVLDVDSDSFAIDEEDESGAVKCIRASGAVLVGIADLVSGNCHHPGVLSVEARLVLTWLEADEAEASPTRAGIESRATVMTIARQVATASHLRAGRSGMFPSDACEVSCRVRAEELPGRSLDVRLNPKTAEAVTYLGLPLLPAISQYPSDWAGFGVSDGLRRLAKYFRHYRPVAPRA